MVDRHAAKTSPSPARLDRLVAATSAAGNGLSQKREVVSLRPSWVYPLSCLCQPELPVVLSKSLFSWAHTVRGFLTSACPSVPAAQCKPLLAQNFVLCVDQDLHVSNCQNVEVHIKLSVSRSRYAKCYIGPHVAFRFGSPHT